MTEDEVVGWHHRLNGHAFEEAPRDGEGQGSLACSSPWGHKELDMTNHLTTAIINCLKHCYIINFNEHIQTII